MRKVIAKVALLLALSTATLTACKKDRESVPSPPPPAGNYAVKVKAAITVGDVVYDSIPATLTITSWDLQGTRHQREAQLAPGTNTIFLPKAHTKYTLQLAKWGVTDERTLMSNQVNETTTYVLGGSKAAKKLKEEMNYVVRDGAYQLSSKRAFIYDNDGRLKEVQNYFVDANQPSSQPSLASTDRFTYIGGRLEVIDLIDKQNPGENELGFNSFSYNQQNKIVAMFYGAVSEPSTAYIEYVPYENRELVRIAYGVGSDLNGSRTELTFAGGNRVEEKNFIPNYPTATRTFTYDGAINPFVHMKWPMVNFAHDSKNNVVEERLDNTSIYLQRAYTYDADGFVKEVVKREVNGATNETRGVFKTVYVY